MVTCQPGRACVAAEMSQYVKFFCARSPRGTAPAASIGIYAQKRTAARHCLLSCGPSSSRHNVSPRRMSVIHYDEVADLYDLHVTVDLDVSFFVCEAHRACGKVLELMAGTGRVSIPLIEAGIELTCVDVSEGMLERLRAKLRAKGLSAAVHRADVRDFDLRERFALAIIPFHSFSEIVEPDDAGRALGSIMRHLDGGGRLVVTLHNPVKRLQDVDGTLRLTSSHVTDAGRLVVSGFERFDPLTRIVTRTQYYELFDKKGLLESKRMLEMRFRLFQRCEFEDLAERAGLEVETLYGDYNYADYDERLSPFMIWVLRHR